MRRIRSTLSAVLAAAGLLGCAESGSPEAGLDELYKQGLIRYVGAFDPIVLDPSPNGAGLRQFVFERPEDPALAAERGPLCLRGGQFTTDTRHGSSDELLIFLGGDGACWSEAAGSGAACTALDRASGLPSRGILDLGSEGNPLADWDVTYVPYCDGSLFTGDVDRLLPPAGGQGEPVPSYQRGLQNLSAALDVAARQFPNPSRVLLSGSGAGGYGTIIAAPLVRYHYPDVPILVFNDSGLGLGRGDANLVDKAFVSETLLGGWSSADLIPASCLDCTSNGHLTRWLEWNLQHDDKLSVAALSYSRDEVQASLLLGLEDFQTPLLAETRRTTQKFPERYKRFILDGTSHTVLLQDGVTEPDPALGSLLDEIEGRSVLDWLTAFVDGSETWVDLVDPTLPDVPAASSSPDE